MYLKTGCFSTDFATSSIPARAAPPPIKTPPPGNVLLPIFLSSLLRYKNISSTLGFAN